MVSDELWDRLEPVLPQCERRSRIQAKALFNREVLRGILYALRTGTQCEYLPQDRCRSETGGILHQAYQDG
ncbi:transposase [Streptomyces mirabilis]|uniref:transposase n=1 Tax=Streptomyces mirabilis TaxID=68239 RepID=UPI003F4C552E